MKPIIVITIPNPDTHGYKNHPAYFEVDIHQSYVPEENAVYGGVVLAANVAADVVALRQARHVALAPRVEEQEKLQEFIHTEDYAIC